MNTNFQICHKCGLSYPQKYMKRALAADKTGRRKQVFLCGGCIKKIRQSKG